MKEVALYPLFNQMFSSIEHPEGMYVGVGDALGRDCMISKFKEGWMRTYDGDGTSSSAYSCWCLAGGYSASNHLRFASHRRTIEGDWRNRLSMLTNQWINQ